MSRSATPTPKAGWSSPTRWRSPTRRRPTCWSTWARSPAPPASRSDPELPPYYTDDEALAAEVARHAAAENDPLWRLPLWQRYDQNIDSKVADVNNVAAGGMAGSIICALFLKRFVSAAKSWLHFDIYAWTPSAKPGRPEGGECQAARALYALLKQRYGR